MARLTVTNEQLRLIQQALDFYARIGIGQLDQIKDHATFQKYLYNSFKDKHGKTDYQRLNEVRDVIDEMLLPAKRILYQEDNVSVHGGWGINHANVDDSCRDAFDLVQVIRHEFWKQDPNRTTITVDSSVHLIDKNNSNIKVEL